MSKSIAARGACRLPSYFTRRLTVCCGAPSMGLYLQ